MERGWFTVGLIILFLVLPQTVASIHSSGSARLDPFQVYVWRITALEGERLEGNITSEQQPIHINIYQDKGYEDISQFHPEDAIYTHFGMFGRFNFYSNEDTDWLFVIRNDNNLTQETEFHCTIHDSQDRVLNEAVPAIALMTIPLLFIIFGPIVYYRRKKHQ